MELMKTGESFKVQLADLEETLLQELAAAEGNILENKTLDYEWVKNDINLLDVDCLRP